MRAATPSLPARRRRCTRCDDRRVVRARAERRRPAGGRSCCAPARPAPSCRDRRARSARRPGATTSAKPCSPMRMRSTIRHISSRLNSPTSQPAGWFSRVRWMANDRGRQQIVVDADRRHRRRRRSVERRVLGNRDARLADAARWRSCAPASSNSVISRNSRNCEDVVLEDASCCRGSRPVSCRSAASAFSSSALVDDVAADFLGGARGDVLVAGDDRFAGAALQRQDRDDAVGEQRHDGRGAEEQRESRGDVPNPKLHPSSCGWLDGYRLPASKAAAYPGYRALVPTGPRIAC